MSQLDFLGQPSRVRLVAEAARLSYGHLVNPAFAIETARIDPLPHQRIAVYERMLTQDPLRFLLADDAGAGKTIMAGLLIREMLARRTVRRVLVVPPAGLVGNWKRELWDLFSLDATVLSGTSFKDQNPLLEADVAIVSIDTLRQERGLKALKDPDLEPFDLVVFDEAHKLSADELPDASIRRTDRYRLGESLAGVESGDEDWRLPWAARHLLLLTATPHMGKDFPYFALWRLLDPDAFVAEQSLATSSPAVKQRHFIRRTKEEMVRFDGTRIYPTRETNTFSYELTAAEQDLYDATTEYLNQHYNKAAILSDTAAQLALSVFQRRLASSTYALLRSFERREAKLVALIDDLQAGRITIDQLAKAERAALSLDDQTADEEEGEAAETDMAALAEQVVASSIDDLHSELSVVRDVLVKAREVHATSDGSKFQRLRELLLEPRFEGEKIIVFTEHRDTLSFLQSRLETYGFGGVVETIHGGMDYKERDAAVARFRKPVGKGGTQILLATDAAGEGINLQFCWVLVNYDVPWNPARLEQRMGRIHRYGQKRDPVIIANLIAGKTREGRVILTLLEKLEKMRKQLDSDKVFDVVGRMLEGVSVRDLMRRALGSDEAAKNAADELGGKLTAEQFRALQEREAKLYGTGGDVAAELPRLRQEMGRELERRLMPGYVHRFVERALDGMDIDLQARGNGLYSLLPRKPEALARLGPWLAPYGERAQRVAFVRPEDREMSVFLHPGEPLFEAVRAFAVESGQESAERGASFLDPSATEPSLYVLASVAIDRLADESIRSLRLPARIADEVVAVRVYADGRVEPAGTEELLLLPEAERLPVACTAFASDAKDRLAEAIRAIDEVGAVSAGRRRDGLLAQVDERVYRLELGFRQELHRLSAAETAAKSKAKSGDVNAQILWNQVAARIKAAQERRPRAIAAVKREPELIQAAPAALIAVALIAPSQETAAAREADRLVELKAVEIVVASEQADGASVRDVSTPGLAVAAGLVPNPGFDLLSERPDGAVRRIEVKGKANKGEVVLTDNEWAAAQNHGDGYWLYVVTDCASIPRLHRVQDPAGRLPHTPKQIIIQTADIENAASRP